MAKTLFIIGILFIVGSIAFYLWEKFMPGSPLGRLPGDLEFKGENYVFRFPLVTCLILSVLLSVILSIIRFFTRG